MTRTGRTTFGVRLNKIWQASQGWAWRPLTFGVIAFMRGYRFALSWDSIRQLLFFIQFGALEHFQPSFEQYFLHPEESPLMICYADFPPVVIEMDRVLEQVRTIYLVSQA